MANNITRWNPFREMMTMQNMVDRLFDENWRPLFEETRVGGMPLPLDVHEDENAYTITTELAGVKPEDINVHQEGDFLVIEAETRDTSTHEQQEGRRALIKERRYGRYTRRLRLPHNIDFDAADANYEDGVLTLTLPKAQEPQPKTIQVRARTNGQNGQNARNSNGGNKK